MHRPAATWAGTLGVLAAYDAWCAYNAVEGDSLSEVTRAVLRTDTARGRALFVVGWTALTAWLIPHICRTIKET